MSGRISFRAVKQTAAPAGKNDVQQQQRQDKSRKRTAQEAGHVASANLSAPLDDDISSQERTLRAFDLSTKFGPCIGLTRLERWERAKKFGLNPPVEVHELLTRGGSGVKPTPIWADRI